VEIAKALILAGGTPHDRPWPSVRTGPKHLVPVANQPILFHTLESLRRANLLEARIALEPTAARATIAAVGSGSRWGLSVSYVEWQPRTGIIGALALSEDFLADEPVLVEPADALHRERIQPHIAAFADEHLDALALRLGDAAAAHCDLGAGGYLLSQRGVSIMLDRSDTGADPLARVRDHGGHVRVEQVDGCLPCHGGQDRLLEGNRCMLENLPSSVRRGAYPTSQFQGRVKVHPSARIEQSVVRGPAIIGAGSRLLHAYVGPYTSIGDDVTLEGAQIEHSIVFDGAEIHNVGSRLESSVIGRRARIRRSFGLPAAMQLSVGDGAEIILG
jgi:glucose-1-phosphate thymidylyltransferase